MGITGELVRSVFSKRRLAQMHESHAHHASSNGVEKKRWRSSVRSYLCGDEHSSVFAAEDSASARSSTVNLDSFRSNRATNTSTINGGDITSVEETASVRSSSEVTVNQPLHGDSKQEIQHNSTYKLFQKEDAAVIIQSAYRSFRAKRVQNGSQIEDGIAASPSRESLGTSIEVQTGNTSDISSIVEERHYTTGYRNRAQVLKNQEDWDDSTVSSVISKMREQHRLEAATRRERALAYAFSQQLRICSKKKQITSNGQETNVSWSWLERWMAARQPEITLTEDSKKTMARKRMLDNGASMEEKESCGSNEVSSLFEVSVLSIPKNVPRPPKTRTKGIRSFSRQNSASSNLCPRESTEMKKDSHQKDEREKRKRPKQTEKKERDQQCSNSS